MTKLALVGATGNIGGRILTEAARRGHDVTAISRHPDKLGEQPANVTGCGADTHDVAGLSEALRHHDWVAVSVRWNDNDIHQVIEAIRQSGVPHSLFVVGAGSLLRENGQTHFDFMSAHGTPLSPTSKPALQALEVIRAVPDLDWRAISPPAKILPGERTGHFRLGQDHLIQDEAGESRVSMEDFAIAILDEIESPRHNRQRFTAAY